MRIACDERSLQPEEGSGASTPVGAPSGDAEDLDFSDLKKKKKSSKKKAALDMEAFEKELNEARAKDGEGEEQIDENDEAELGDDPFARGGEPVAVDTEGEAWLNSDRDYTYAEVQLVLSALLLHFAHHTV